MLSTPQKRSGASTMFGSPKKVAAKGLFLDGVWYCNCSPRLPASHFQVKKEGPNKGRWFYTCQESNENGCGFFIWDEDAAPREMKAVINNSRSETEESRAPAKEMAAAAVDGGTRPGGKWIENLGKSEDDEFGKWPLSPGEDKKMVAGVERQVGLPEAYPETPRKAAKGSMFTTPGSKRKREYEMLPTPITGNRTINSLAAGNDDDVFSTPSTLPTPTNTSFEIRSPSNTPTPSRFRDAAEPANTRPEATKLNFDISEEVMDLLKDQHLDEPTSSNLKELLNKHALRISGIAKGRDITRIALKAKDVKIAELQQKISALEAEREMDKTVIRHFKSDMAHSIAKRGGRGRGKS